MQGQRCGSRHLLKCSKEGRIEESIRRARAVSKKERGNISSTAASIGFFKAVLESYEDVAIFSVLDGDRGLIELIYPASFEDDVRGIIADMIQYGIGFREVPDVQ